MLGVERGNTDLIIFVMMVIVLWLHASPRFRVRLLGYAGILVAAVLKLFPFFAIIICLREKRSRAFVILAASFVLFGLYAVATLNDLRTIQMLVPQPTTYSYGAEVVLERFNSAISGNVSVPLSPILMLPLAGLLFMVGSFLGFHGSILGSSQYLNEKEGCAFLAGVSIYVGSFVAGINWDYRLIFLLLTVPQLFAWSKGKNRYGAISLITVFALAGILWLGVGLRIGRSAIFPIDQFIEWWLFFYYTYASMRLLRQLIVGSGASVPGSVRWFEG
jgi:hypothetical protein